METIDCNLSTKYDLDIFILCIVYVDDTVFGINVDNLCQQFTIVMQTKFEMFMLRELFSFIVLQFEQTGERIVISKTKYLKECIFNIKSHGHYVV